MQIAECFANLWRGRSGMSCRWEWSQLLPHTVGQCDQWSMLGSYQESTAKASSMLSLFINHLTLVSDIQMGAVCCFSSRSVTLVYQLSPCSWRVPETIAMSILRGTLCRATTCQDVTPQFLQFLALLQQLLARHVSLPEIETFVMTQERIVVQVLKRRWHHHLARGLRAVWVFKAVLQPICNRRPRSNSGWG